MRTICRSGAFFCRWAAAPTVWWSTPKGVMAAVVAVPVDRDPERRTAWSVIAVPHAAQLATTVALWLVLLAPGALACAVRQHGTRARDGQARLQSSASAAGGARVGGGGTVIASTVGSGDGTRPGSPSVTLLWHIAA
jgi:hypothetical protein